MFGNLACGYLGIHGLSSSWIPAVERAGLGARVGSLTNHEPCRFCGVDGNDVPVCDYPCGRQSFRFPHNAEVNYYPPIYLSPTGAVIFISFLSPIPIVF